MAKFQQRIIDNNDAVKQRIRIVLDMMNGNLVDCDVMDIL